MSEPVVRLANAEDADELARLRLEFSRELGQADGGDLRAYRLQYRAWLAAALATGRWHVWVADAGDRLVGKVYLQVVDVVPRPWDPPKRRWGYVTTFYVDPVVRNAGVGTRLMAELTALARSLGLELLQVWPSERSAPLYRRLGFAPSPDALELPIHKG
jgi:GNAT superfamily N-acetyltransferase